MVVFYNNYNSANLSSAEVPRAGGQAQTTAEQLADLRLVLARAQAENRAHQARFSTLMQAVDEGVLLTNCRGEVLATNAYCRELLGLSPEPGLLPAQDIAATLQHRFREPAGFLASIEARRAAGPGTTTTEFALADGRLLECRHVVPADEHLDHLLVFRAAPAVRQSPLVASAELFATLLDHLKVEVAVFDPGHRYRYVNARCFKDPGMRQWIIGKNDFELSARCNRPDDLAERRQQLFEEAVRTRTEQVWEEAFVTADGPQLMKRHFIPVFAADGTLHMVVGTGSNVTRHRQADQKLVEQRTFFEHTLDNIPCDIGVFDAQGRYLFVNATGIRDAAKRAWIIGYKN